MKLIQVYDENEGNDLALLDISECSCPDTELETVITDAFKMEDIDEREQFLEEYGIFRVYIDREVGIDI